MAARMMNRSSCLLQEQRRIGNQAFVRLIPVADPHLRRIFLLPIYRFFAAVDFEAECIFSPCTYLRYCKYASAAVLKSDQYRSVILGRYRNFIVFLSLLLLSKG